MDGTIKYVLLMAMSAELRGGGGDMGQLCFKHNARFIECHFLEFQIVNKDGEWTEVASGLRFQCLKLRVYPAPCVHDLAAGCIDFETCTTGVCMLLPTFE